MATQPLQPRIKLVPVDNKPTPAPAQEEGFMVHIGHSSFYVRHLRDGAVMTHTQQEWQALFGTKLQEFAQQLQDDNPDFHAEDAHEIRIDLSGRVTYKTVHDKNRSIRLANVDRASIRALTELVNKAPSQRALDPNTIEGSFHQGNSPNAQIGPGACTTINAEFATRLLLSPEGATQELVGTLIDDSILKGQLKHGQMIPAVRENRRLNPDQAVHMDFAFSDVEGIGYYFPLLAHGPTLEATLPENEAAQCYLEQLKKLTSNVDPIIHAVYCGITNSHGESFGLAVFKNTEDEGVREVIYFDSHSNEANGTPNACIKRFKTLEKAAAFLAKRNSYRANADNRFTITPMCLDMGLYAFCQASYTQNVDKLYVVYTKLGESNPILRDIIAYIVSSRFNPSNPSIKEGDSQIQVTKNRLLGVTYEEILAEFEKRERTLFH